MGEKMEKDYFPKFAHGKSCLSSAGKEAQTNVNLELAPACSLGSRKVHLDSANNSG